MAVAPVLVESSFGDYLTQCGWAAGDVGASGWQSTCLNILEQMESSQLMQRMMSILVIS
jgi:hypothetical protein